MKMTTSPLHRNWREMSRRRFLRGTGVVMALPWLESLPVWGAEPAAAAPRRLAILFMGNGVNPAEWWARGSGAEIELGRSLAPMEPLKGQFNYIKGLFNKAATGVGIHPGMTGNLLSGAQLTKGAALHGGQQHLECGARGRLPCQHQIRSRGIVRVCLRGGAIGGSGFRRTIRSLIRQPAKHMNLTE